MKKIIYFLTGFLNSITEWNKLLFINSIVIILTLLSFQSKAQNNNLAAGDIAFVSYHADVVGAVNDQFSIVVLETSGIAGSTVIYFTDNGWGVGINDWIPSNEGYLKWTAPAAGVDRGTEIYFSSDAGDNWTASLGTLNLVSGANIFALSNSGDQIIAYQTGPTGGPAGTYLNTTRRFLGGIHCNIIANITTHAGWDVGISSGVQQSAMPPGLRGSAPNETAFVMTYSTLPFSGTVTGYEEPDNGKYNCTGSAGATSTDDIYGGFGATNWNLLDNAFPSGQSSNNCFYFGPPVITTQPLASVKCAGLSVNLGVVADGYNSVLTYQWQESTVPTFFTRITLTNTGIYSGATSPTLTISDNTTVTGRYYRCVVTNSAGTTSSVGALLTATSPVLPTGHTIVTQSTSIIYNDLFYDAGCVIIAKVVPSGAQPVNGNITCETWRETSVLYNMGEPYVQRHYQITPSSANASAATATVTLYFSQADFDNYNADPGSTLNLPANPTDASGIANLYISKYRGSSDNGTGRPGSYNEGASLIDPHDRNIVWNATFNQWEVTFDVSGFSGFIVRADPVVLPVMACVGSPVSFTFLNGPGQYQWQESVDATFTSPVTLINTGIYSNVTTSTLNISDNTTVTGRYYRCSTVPNSGNTVISNGAQLTTRLDSLPSFNASVTQAVNVSNNIYGTNCTVLAKVVPAGPNPVTGNVTVQTSRAADVVIINSASQPYVQRVYGITPATSASTATALVTLYFSQADFNNYNANPNTDNNLPVDAADVANNKANLRIAKANLTPSGFLGINPPDANIIWNPTYNRWEVTFSVSGFFGSFYVYASQSTLITPFTACSGISASFAWGGLPPFDCCYSWEESTDADFTWPIALSDNAVYNGTGTYQLTITNNTGLNGRYYRQSHARQNGAFTTNGGLLTVTPPTLPAGHVIETHIAGANNNLSYAAGCAIISRVVPTGGTPVSGNIISEVWREAEVITNTGQPYVQRHYQLTPAAGSTATVTLYYSQTEFDNFNAAPGSTLDLPANAGDATGKANLRVFKYSGSTSNGSGLPNTYTSGVTFINPDDVNIVWNATFNYWEVIFDVAGFSGFFIGTADLRYCPGSTITLSQAGTTFQWQSDNGTGSFSNLLNGGNYAGTGTGNLVISNIPGSFYNYKYRCLVNGSFYSEVITIKALVSWTGNTSTAWEDPLNWGCSVIPDINTDVLLVNNLSRYPVVNNNTTVRSLTVSPGASIIIATGVKLTINH